MTAPQAMSAGPKRIPITKQWRPSTTGFGASTTRRGTPTTTWATRTRPTSGRTASSTATSREPAAIVIPRAVQALTTARWSTTSAATPPAMTQISAIVPSMKATRILRWGHHDHECALRRASGVQRTDQQRRAPDSRSGRRQKAEQVIPRRLFAKCTPSGPPTAGGPASKTDAPKEDA